MWLMLCWYDVAFHVIVVLRIAEHITIEKGVLEGLSVPAHPAPEPAIALEHNNIKVHKSVDALHNHASSIVICREIAQCGTTKHRGWSETCSVQK